MPKSTSSSTSRGRPPVPARQQQQQPAPAEPEYESPLDAAGAALKEQERDALLIATDPAHHALTTAEKAEKLGVSEWRFLSILARPQVSAAVSAVLDARLIAALPVMESAMVVTASERGKGGYFDRARALELAGRKQPAKTSPMRDIAERLAAAAERREEAIKSAEASGIKLDGENVGDRANLEGRKVAPAAWEVDAGDYNLSELGDQGDDEDDDAQSAEMPKF